ncbi:hypothetical protein B6U71_02375 [Euryarchaeota archaeon ex4484_178]|nr:MAG: hypothetical protein B6U71_02375 [Euryarchaeota archaeon ex4484_178]
MSLTSLNFHVDIPLKKGEKGTIVTESETHSGVFLSFDDKSVLIDNGSPIVVPMRRYSSSFS